MFTRTEWLTKLQVQGFFSRLSARQRLTGRKEFTPDEVTDDLDEETEEEHASRQDENVFDVIHDAVVSSFKVKMLREICTYFEIRFKIRDTKSELAKKLTEMVLDCSCLST